MTNYIFGDNLGKLMANVSPKTQYEGTMLGIVLMLVSLLISGIYYLFFTNAAIFSKILIGVNGACGLLILQSFLVTTFQQYRSFMEIQEFQKAITEVPIEDIKLTQDKNESS